jgi:hypothetical protein
VGDESMARELKRQAREIFAQAALLALALTAIVRLLPARAV